MEKTQIILLAVLPFLLGCLSGLGPSNVDSDIQQSSNTSENDTILRVSFNEMEPEVACRENKMEPVYYENLSKIQRVVLGGDDIGGEWGRTEIERGDDGWYDRTSYTNQKKVLNNNSTTEVLRDADGLRRYAESSGDDRYLCLIKDGKPYKINVFRHVDIRHNEFELYSFDVVSHNPWSLGGNIIRYESLSRRSQKQFIDSITRAPYRRLSYIKYHCKLNFDNGPLFQKVKGYELSGEGGRETPPVRATEEIREIVYRQSFIKYNNTLYSPKIIEPCDDPDVTLRFGYDVFDRILYVSGPKVVTLDDFSERGETKAMQAIGQDASFTIKSNTTILNQSKSVTHYINDTNGLDTHYFFHEGKWYKINIEEGRLPVGEPVRSTAPSP